MVYDFGQLHLKGDPMVPLSRRPSVNVLRKLSEQNQKIDLKVLSTKLQFLKKVTPFSKTSEKTYEKMQFTDIVSSLPFVYT